MKTKVCTKCRQKKQISEFYRNRTYKDGYASACKICALAGQLISRNKNRAAYNARARLYHAAHRRRQRNGKLRKNYGITLEQYESMVANQQGKCDICGRIPDLSTQRLCVDHDHITKKVRALLCTRCNQALGYFDENPELMEKAAAYVRRH